jgi:hypothetical protein
LKRIAGSEETVLEAAFGGAEGEGGEGPEGESLSGIDVDRFWKIKSKPG